MTINTAPPYAFAVCLLFTLVALASAGARTEEGNGVAQNSPTDGLAEEVLSRMQEAGESVASFSVVQDQWQEGEPAQQVHSERVYTRDGYYVRKRQGSYSSEFLYYRGSYFQRDTEGNWTPESQLESGARHAQITVEPGEFGTGALRSIPMAGHYVHVQGSEIQRLSDEVVDGERLIRLKSRFAEGEVPGVSITQDIWVNAETFLVSRTEYTATFSKPEAASQVMRVVINYSRFGESELPGPLPQS